VFGKAIEGIANVYCNNNTMVKNTQILEATLRRKHDSIAYYCICEAAAAGTIQVAKESHETSIADMLTES
jgi:hypothetical protein